MTRYKLFIFILFFFTFNLYSQTGWIIVDQSGDTTYLLKGTFMSVWENGNFILDANQDEVTFVNHIHNIYSKTSLDEYCKSMTARAEEIKAYMSEEQIEELYKEPEEKKLNVEIIKVGPGDKISGFNTMKYNVMVDGNLYEEVWITTDPSLMDYYKTVIKSLTKMDGCLAQMRSKDDPENTPEYRKFMQEGFELKSIDYVEGMGKDIDEIKLLEKRTFSKKMFEVPAGYKNVTIDEFLQFQMEFEHEEDDDEEDDLDFEDN